MSESTDTRNWKKMKEGTPKIYRVLYEYDNMEADKKDWIPIYHEYVRYYNCDEYIYLVSLNAISEKDKRFVRIKMKDRNKKWINDREFIAGEELLITREKDGVSYI